ncbi:hypothetical protein HII36_37095 [Nonomuraea sp. NN258]|uniref:hypothetical protein n=1 Tax=Nonomuraea antri TaxID=2730852 RepID=UPI0015697BD0|nr:hypothetical protein [Nonomuraea antri]NRQ37412.1 hypothetical protein [Nonomuraea antri]
MASLNQTPTSRGATVSADIGSTSPQESPQAQSRRLLELLNGWLQVTVPREPHIGRIIPLVREAIQLYRASRYVESLNRTQKAMEILERVGHPVPGSTP